MKFRVGQIFGGVLANDRRPKHERMTKEEIEDVIESYKRMKWWP
jgi:hypothetical protein